jgi:hypothetical protein
MSDYKKSGKLDAAGIAKLMNSDSIIADLEAVSYTHLTLPTID